MTGNIDIPEDFDIEAAFTALRTFTQLMHEEGFYHRDLREGNIMLNVHRKAGEPYVYVVDMGYSTQAFSDEHAYKDFTGPKDHVIMEVVHASLVAYVQRRKEGESV